MGERGLLIHLDAVATLTPTAMSIPRFYGHSVADSNFTNGVGLHGASSQLQAQHDAGADPMLNQIYAVLREQQAELKALRSETHELSCQVSSLHQQLNDRSERPGRRLTVPRSASVS